MLCQCWPILYDVVPALADSESYSSYIILANLVDSQRLVYKAHPLIIPVNHFREYT